MRPIVRAVQLQRGYSLLELMLVVGIMGVLGGFAIFQIGNVRPYLRGDGAMRTVIAQLNTARELSIAQRRNIQVSFAGNVLTITRQNIPSGTTVLAAVPMEGGVQFGLTPGVPDTPDAFGNSTATYFGTATRVFFTTDGSLISDAGLPVNGTVFLTVPNQPRAARAVTVLGATGRIRGYKWDSRQWVRG